jgi:hypothetical protein
LSLFDAEIRRGGELHEHAKKSGHTRTNVCARASAPEVRSDQSSHRLSARRERARKRVNQLIQARG